MTSKRNLAFDIMGGNNSDLLGLNDDIVTTGHFPASSFTSPTGNNYSVVKNTSEVNPGWLAWWLNSRGGK